MLLFTLYNTTLFTTMCLAALPAKMSGFKSHMQQNAQRLLLYCNLKWTFEDLMPCYCYGLKTNSRTIRSQVWQPASEWRQMNGHEWTASSPLHDTRTVIWISIWKHALRSHFLKFVQVELYSSLRKVCTFSHPLQLLLNWGIIQYHDYCELHITDSELDLNYPQLRLRCSRTSLLKI